MNSRIVNFSVAIIINLLFSNISSAQNLKVKDMRMILSDLSASTHQREDSLGIPCGLVKVQLTTPNTTFEGNVVGLVENQMNEYWVYLPKGAKKLMILRNHFLPYEVNFNDFGIERIESKVTYHLILKEVKFNQEKNSLILSVRPKDASLVIDNYAIENSQDGSYKLFLEKGEHVCRLKANGYKSKVEIVNIGKGPVELSTELESLMADVKINCGTTDADIFIDKKNIGKGTWIGQLPAGTYEVSSQKEGFESFSQSIIVKEKENVNIDVPKLKRQAGCVYVVSNVDNINEIKIDGKVVEMSNGKILDVMSGNHVVSLVKYGYNKAQHTIFVKGNDKDTIKHTFVVINNEYKNALHGDASSQRIIGHQCEQKGDYKQAIYWLSQAVETPKDYYHVTDDRLLLARMCSDKDKPDFYDIAKAKEYLFGIIEYFRDKINEENGFDAYMKVGLSALGDLCKDNKMYDEAISWYKQYVQYDNGDTSSLVCIDIGDCYLQLGDKSQAKEWYIRVAEGGSESGRKRAKKNLVQLNY